jgi:hypothetical protein
MTAPDYAEARRFLTLLDESAEHFAFRVFDDDDQRATQTKASHPRGLDHRARKYDGPFDNLAGILAKANADRCGVFVVANAGGQKKDAITRVRAVFADTDGADLDPIMMCQLEPHFIVESSPNKWHAYWLVDGLRLDQFEGVQRQIAHRFGTDPSVHDLPRVMRVPGFDHHKAAPHRVRIIRESTGLPYPADAILAEFPPMVAASNATTSASQPDPSDGTGVVVDRGRHDDSLRFTGRMARAVTDGGMGEATAWSAIMAEADRGRWTRAMPELRREFDDALRKIRSGELPTTRTRNVAPANSEAANDGPAVKRPRVLGLVRADQIQLTPIDWTIRDYMVTDTLAGLVGASGAGKSFIAIGMACCIATGTPWHGREVRRGGVFYLAGEGQRGLKKRIAAWELHNGVSTDGAPLYISAGLPFLCDAEMAEASADEIAEAAAELAEESGLQPALIVIDTVARAMGGADENTSQDMGAFVSSMDVLRQRWGCVVMSVHHTGHSSEAQGRARGSSAYRAALDSEFVVAGKGDDVTFVGTKEKDWPKPSPISFHKVSVPILVPGVDGGLVEESGLVLHDVVGAVIEANKRETAMELHRSGQTLRAISVQLGVSKSTIGNWLKAA